MDIANIIKMKSLFASQEGARLQSGLKVGATVAGRVTQNFGHNQFMVSLRGVNVMAQSDLPIVKGDRFKARIEAVKPKLLLKIISSAHNEGIAEQWGLNEDEQKLLNEMSASKLPLNRKNFDRINDVVKKFAGHHKLKADYGEIARAAVKLERQGLELNLENISRQLKAVKGDFNLADLMVKINTMLGEAGENLPQELAQFIKDLPQNFTPEALQKNLPAIVILLGLVHESDLKNLLLKGKFVKHLNLKFPLFKMLTENPGSADHISKMMSDIEAMQLRNLPENRITNGDTYYIQVPVFLNDEWEKVDLFFHSENQSGSRVDKDNVSIRVNLDTKYLGKVSVLTEIKNGAVNIKFYLENEDITNFIQPHLEELNKTLDALDYDIQSISAMTMAAKENFDENMLFPASVIKHSEGTESVNMIV